MAKKRLFIDLSKCENCRECAVSCGYFYRPAVAPATDHGVLRLREMAVFALVCRRCENPSCAAACRFQALERQPDGSMKRYSMRCVSCTCCAHACPFGTIYPDLVPYLGAGCDFCENRGEEGEPLCVGHCEHGAIRFEAVEPSEKESIYLLNDAVAVRSPRWVKENV